MYLITAREVNSDIYFPNDIDRDEWTSDRREAEVTSLSVPVNSLPRGKIELHFWTLKLELFWRLLSNQQQ
jgi:hypothetical protein